MLIWRWLILIIPIKALIEAVWGDPNNESISAYK